MSNDSTLESTDGVEAPQDSVDTLNVAVDKEPTETPIEEPSDLVKKEEPRKYFGRFNSIEEAEVSYKEMQTAYQKIKEDLKAVEKAQKESQLKQLDKMDYDEKVAFLAQEMQSMRDQIEATKIQNETVSSVLAEEYAEKEVAEYVANNPLLKESGMDEWFIEMSLSPKYREYTLDSIFEKMFKPKIEGLMGKKIKIKETPLTGETKIEQPKRAIEMTAQEYEKNRESILKQMESEMKSMKADII